MIGREGAGASIFNAVLQVERSFVFATQVGAMQRQLEDSVRVRIDSRAGRTARSAATRPFRIESPT